MNIYILRHAETIFNIKNKLQGHIDSNLTTLGVNQAQKCSMQLKTHKFSLILCSPLGRTVKTAEIINKELKIPIIYDNRLKERNYGDFEGLTGDKININLLWNFKENYSKNNVEPIKSFFNRMFKFLKDVEEKYCNKNILIVTHSGNTIVADCYYEGFPKDYHFFSLGSRNCEFKKYVRNINSSNTLNPS